MTIPSPSAQIAERLSRENGYMPCPQKDCPYCLRGLQRKCPQQDEWDCVLGLVTEAYEAGIAAALPDQGPARTPAGEFKAYQLPNTRIVLVDATAAKDARCIDYTLEDGSMVAAVQAELNTHAHTWTCGCGWRNGVELPLCAQCSRRPGGEDNPCTQDEICIHQASQEILTARLRQVEQERNHAVTRQAELETKVAQVEQELEAQKETQQATDQGPARTPAGEEWRCFHCNEVFTDEAEGREHFGLERDCSIPACRLSAEDVTQLRDLETQNAELRAENGRLDNSARLWHEADTDRQRRIGNREWWQEIDFREGEKLVLQEQLAASTVRLRQVEQERDEALLTKSIGAHDMQFYQDVADAQRIRAESAEQEVERQKALVLAQTKLGVQSRMEYLAAEQTLAAVRGEARLLPHAHNCGWFNTGKAKDCTCRVSKLDALLASRPAGAPKE
mgnify:CR=1 FL=1